MKLSRFWLIILAVLAMGLGGCSSFYYFPSKQVLVYRDKMPIQPEDVYFESTDGTKLHAWYFGPLNKKEPTAVIVQFHGNAENLTTHFFTLYEAPSRGFAYLVFDYRGYGKSEGSPTPAGVVQDGIAAVRWMHKKHPDKPLVIVGQSLGGAIAMRAVNQVKNEVPISLMMVDSTFADYRTQARSMFSSSVLTFLFQPLAWLAADNSQSPREDIAQISPIPLIVVHGDKDRVVDQAMGKEVYALAKEPKEFWSIPDCQHVQFMFKDEGEQGERFYTRVAEIAQRQP
jgi:alpha-beta hydrolase superfamily lysophospholipase